MKNAPPCDWKATKRFAAKIERQPNGCWLWVASRTKAGYGHMYVAGSMHYTHRLAYSWLTGGIPDGLQIDHLCRNRACCNPEHLEPVTTQENTRRGDGGIAQRSRTRCPSGHPYDEGNTKLYRGMRYCRACTRIRRARMIGPRRPRALKTHCPQGHGYNEENTRVDKNGHRKCRTCNRERARVNAHKSREGVKSS